MVRSEAQREFLGVPFPFRRQLNQLIFKLIENPRPRAAELIDGDSYRLAAHGWVILYEVDDEKAVVFIVAFRKATSAPET